MTVDDWYFDKELTRLRAEMVGAYREWDSIRPPTKVSTELTPQQDGALMAFVKSEQAYLGLMEKLRDGEIQPSFDE